MSENIYEGLDDRFRIEWLSINPVNTKWTRERGWVVSHGFPFGEAEGITFQVALDRAIHQQLAAMESMKASGKLSIRPANP
jgi:hypothetical protein